MAKENYQQVEKLFQSAVKIVAEKRTAFLDEVCCGNDSLRREVESLLSSHDDADSFLETPAIVEVAEISDTANPVLANGQSLKQYEIIKQIGTGGMGEVYLANDTKLYRKVALKVLHSDLSSDKNASERLLREALAVAKLEHPNICAIHEIAETEDRSFIVMQHIEGETLAEILAKEPLSLETSLDLAIQIAGALEEAHTHHIIHRDIKPANVIVNEKGQAKVLDFGLAKIIEAESEAETAKMLSGSGAIMGTTPYMSPEQLRGKALDSRTDIFSFGVMFYEMLSGKQPFNRETNAQTIAAILKTEPPTLGSFVLDITVEMERIVTKCLRKNREERYKNTEDLLNDLRELRHEFEFGDNLKQEVEPTGFRNVQTDQSTVITEPENVRRVSSAEYITTGISRHKFATLVGLATLVIAVGLVGYYFYSNSAKTAVLTDKDIILLTDFENKTGEDIFDGTLKQGLRIQLRQSPFLSIFPDEQARNTLELMKRSKDERITRELARDICQRQGLKAYIVGTISKFGTRYALSLEAINSVSGETFAITQVEAENKEKILQALSQASTEMRKKLGESLATIEKFDKPLQVITTKSLGALKAYSTALKQQSKGNDLEALSFYERAVELDPDFAFAYLSLAGAYRLLAQYEKGENAIAKAYKLREKTSERERLIVDDWYFGLIVKDSRKTIEVLKMGKNLYPRESIFRADLGFEYGVIGQIEKAIEELEELIRLTRLKMTIDLGWHGIIARHYLLDNRLDDAKKTVKESLQRGFNYSFNREVAFKIAFIEENNESMQEQINWFKGRPDEFKVLNLQAEVAAFHGKFEESQKLSQQAIVFTEQTENKEAQILYSVLHESTATIFGDCSQTKSIENVPVRLIENYNPATFTPISLARCGKFSEAEKQINQLKEKYPQSTLGNGIWIPMFKAQIELEKDNPQEAIDLLENAKRFEWAAHAHFYPQFIKGQAHLKLGENEKAKVEFQKILDNRGKGSLSVLYPLAQLGKARATKNKLEYEKFFEMWKDADEDLPALIAAKKEYAELD